MRELIKKWWIVIPDDRNKAPRITLDELGVNTYWESLGGWECADLVLITGFKSDAKEFLQKRLKEKFSA